MVGKLVALRCQARLCFLGPALLAVRNLDSISRKNGAFFGVATPSTTCIEPALTSHSAILTQFAAMSFLQVYLRGQPGERHVDKYSVLIIMRHLVDFCQTLLGASHPHTVEAQEALAIHYLQLRQDKILVDLDSSAAPMPERRLKSAFSENLLPTSAGPEHCTTQTLIEASNAKSLLPQRIDLDGNKESEQPKAAEDLLRVTAAACEKLLGPDHPSTVEVLWIAAIQNSNIDTGTFRSRA